MSGEISAAELLAAQHGPGGAGHLVVLAVLVVIALVFFGVKRWRGRRASAPEQQSAAHDPSAASTDSTEEN